MLAVRPDPVRYCDVHTNDSSVYVTFDSPKSGKNLKYMVSANCSEDGSREVKYGHNG